MATFVEQEDASVRLQDLTILVRTRSELQQIVLYKHPSLGLVLTIDEELQHVEAWQSLYHEPLVHLPASFIPSLRDVLILGGGDLFAAKEVLKYPTVRSVRLVEHDPNMIDITRRYYSHANAVLSDPRLTIKFTDAREEFVASGPKYDLIINDCFDLSLSSTHRSAYQNLERRLALNGVCSDMIYRHVFARRIVQRSLSRLAKCSRFVIGLITVPEYPGALHLLTLWGSNKYLSQNSKSLKNISQRRYRDTRKGLQFEYYDPRYREFFLYVPPYVRNAIA